MGVLTTESSHPVTANLSEVAKRDVSAALGLLFEVDGDVVRKYREFAESGRAREHRGHRAARAEERRQGLLHRLRLDRAPEHPTGVHLARLLAAAARARLEVLARAGRVRESRLQRDGRRRLCPHQIRRRLRGLHGVRQEADWGPGRVGQDVVFAITEGGETSFVIGTAWKGLEVGAKVYFVYNNPDDILCKHVQRSREVIQEPRIEKINLTTGPMSITGSTRMQATTIQLCVMLTVLEMVLRDLMKELEPKGPCALDSAVGPGRVPEASGGDARHPDVAGVPVAARQALCRWRNPFTAPGTRTTTSPTGSALTC